MIDKKYIRSILAVFTLTLCGCATSSPIQRYSESDSHFRHPPKLIDNNYPSNNIYRIYHRASTGFTPTQAIRRSAEARADEFARRQGKSFVILGEKTSSPPHILGNFPRIEIVFALIDAPVNNEQISLKGDKYTELEKLKKLLDEGALTKEEFEQEKTKVLAR